MSSSREVIEGIQEQGINEGVIYQVATTNWGGSPSSPDFDIFDEDDYSTSLKATLSSGAATVSGDSVILPKISGGTERKIYRVFVSFISGGNDLEGYFRIQFKR